MVPFPPPVHKDLERVGLEPPQGEPASFVSSLVKDLTSGFTRQSVLSTPGIRTANPHENTRQPRLPRLTPLTHPQPVSPLQQQRPLVGDGLRLRAVWWVGDRFCFVHAANSPLRPYGTPPPQAGEDTVAIVLPRSRGRGTIRSMVEGGLSTKAHCSVR